MTIDPISSGLVQSMPAAAPGSSRASATAPSASAGSTASASSPAATVSVSGKPASVDADDQATYSRVLAAARGNVNAAAAAVSSEDRKTGES